VTSFFVEIRGRWAWSSAAAHVAGKDDGLVRVGPLLKRAGDWREFLSAGLEADEAGRFRRHERTGRPLGQARFLERIEKTLGRVIRPNKRGPKAKSVEN